MNDVIHFPQRLARPLRNFGASLSAAIEAHELAVRFLDLSDAELARQGVTREQVCERITRSFRSAA